MSNKKYSRREFLGASLRASGGLAILPLIHACSQQPDLVCNDASQLSRGDIIMRNSLGYVEASPDASSQCQGCGYFSGVGAIGCGNCQIFSGPVNPGGVCESWVKKS